MTSTVFKIILLTFFILILPWKARANVSKISIKEISYGTSFSGKKLMAYKLFQEGEFKLRRLALLTDGIHGNEYTGIGNDFVNDLQKNIKKLSVGLNKFLSVGGVFLIVPKVNPDGVGKGSRYSALGSDLNRDFNRVEDKPFFSQQETFYLDQLVRNEIANSSQLVLAIDYHCCAKSLLYPPSLTGKGKPQMKNFYEEIFSSLKKSLGRNYILATSSNVFGEKLEGTMKNYWYSEYGALSFTFEGHHPKHDKNQSSKHLKWWDSMFDYVSNMSHQSLAFLQEVPASRGHKNFPAEPQPVKYSE